MTKLMPKYGPKPIILAGTILLTAAMFWYARVNADSGYSNLFLPGMIVMAIGMGCIFVPLTTVAVSRVRNTDAGVASAMLNVGQQVGGAIGLSVLATVAATAGRSAGTSHRAATCSRRSSPAPCPRRVLDTPAGSSPRRAPAPSRHSPRAARLGRGARCRTRSRRTPRPWASSPPRCSGSPRSVVAAVMINVKRDEVPESPMEAVVAA